MFWCGRGIESVGREARASSVARMPALGASVPWAGGKAAADCAVCLLLFPSLLHCLEPAA